MDYLKKPFYIICQYYGVIISIKAIVVIFLFCHATGRIKMKRLRNIRKFFLMSVLLAETLLFSGYSIAKKHYNSTAQQTKIWYEEALLTGDENKKNVVVTDTIVDSIKITIFYSNMLKISFSTKRPDSNSINIRFCIPAAFTKNYKDDSISGFVVENGRIFFNDVDTTLTGGLIIENDSVFYFIGLEQFNDSLISFILENKADFFQQILLVKDKVGHKENLFKSKAIQCRAFCILHQQPCVIESKEKVTLSRFIKVLEKLQVQDAIYTDMGSWSEGWYKTENDRIFKTGNNRISTHLQSNWLYFYW